MERKVKVIVVTARKGGTGKSTISSHLSVCAGPNTILIDTDDQANEGSCSTWIEARKEETPRFFSYDDFKNHGLEKLIQVAEDNHAEYVIVDTAPTADKNITDMMRLADIILIITEPSFFPLKSLPRSLKMVQASGKPHLVVLNKVRENRLEANETRAWFTESGLPFVQVNDLAPISRALPSGKTVHEFAPTTKSAEQVSELWNKITEIVK